MEPLHKGKGLEQFTSSLRQGGFGKKKNTVSIGKTAALNQLVQGGQWY